MLYLTGIRVQKVHLTLPPGAVIGDKFCVDDPTDCCTDGDAVSSTSTSRTTSSSRISTSTSRQWLQGDCSRIFGFSTWPLELQLTTSGFGPSANLCDVFNGTFTLTFDAQNCIWFSDPQIWFICNPQLGDAITPYNQAWFNWTFGLYDLNYLVGLPRNIVWALMLHRSTLACQGSAGYVSNITHNGGNVGSWDGMSEITLGVSSSPNGTPDCPVTDAAIIDIP